MAVSPNTLTDRLADVTHTAGENEYTDTCRLFNSAIDKKPAYVVRCRDTTDVVAAIAWARDSGMELAVRGGGHSVSGASLNDGGVVLDVRALNAIDVDPARLTVTVGGGATTGEVDVALQGHGLATTLGRVSTTGVVGCQRMGRGLGALGSGKSALVMPSPWPAGHWTSSIR